MDLSPFGQEKPYEEEILFKKLEEFRKQVDLYLADVKNKKIKDTENIKKFAKNVLEWFQKNEKTLQVKGNYAEPFGIESYDEAVSHVKKLCRDLEDQDKGTDEKLSKRKLEALLPLSNQLKSLYLTLSQEGFGQ